MARPVDVLTVDAVARYRHLRDHVAPIWKALPEDRRGTFYVGEQPKHARDELAANHGIVANVAGGYPHHGNGYVIAANHDDYNNTERRPVIYVEHGAGQTYADWPTLGSYSGSTEHPRVALYLTTNDDTAARERNANPGAVVEVIGSPRLDELAAVTRDSRGSLPRVAFCWHWDCHIVPETRSAFREWQSTMIGLRSRGYEVLGHGHPRIWPELERWYRRAGIEPVAEFRDVIARADVVCFDNTSAGYEAAALGVPVIALDAKFYRAGVRHGLRFSDMIPGPVARNDYELVKLLPDAVADRWKDQREYVSEQVYPPHTRGQAAKLAATAILELLPD